MQDEDIAEMCSQKTLCTCFVIFTAIKLSRNTKKMN